VKVKFIVVSKFSQDSPWNIETILANENIENGQKARHRKLSIAHDGLIRGVIPRHHLFPPSQIALYQWHMKGLILKGIEFGITQESVIVTIVHSKDAREGSPTIVREPPRLQVIEGCEWIQNSLLGLEKDLIDPEQILGTALDALSDETKSLHERDNLLSGTRQSLLVRHACTVRGSKEVHFVSRNDDWHLHVEKSKGDREC
jgi:hypothetical protein